VGDPTQRGLDHQQPVSLQGHLGDRVIAVAQP
jgi:hypothetical protein